MSHRSVKAIKSASFLEKIVSRKEFFFGNKGYGSTYKDVNSIHQRTYFKPIDPYNMTR